MQRLRLRRLLWWWTAGMTVVLAAVALVVWLRPSSERTLPPTRATEYKDVQACLLTGPQGLADPRITPIWDGMQDASKATQARVSYLATDNSDPAPYVATLIQRKCTVVVTAEASHSAAAAALASEHPNVRFAQIGGSSASSNVVGLPNESTEQKTAIAHLISNLVPK